MSKSRNKSNTSAHPLTAIAIGGSEGERKAIESDISKLLAEAWEKMTCCEQAALTLGIRMAQYNIKSLEQLRELQNLLNHLIRTKEDGNLSVSIYLMEFMGEKEKSTGGRE